MPRATQLCRKDTVNHEELRLGVPPERPGKCMTGLHPGQLVEERARVDEAGGVSADDRLVGQVLGKHGLPHTVRPDEDHVGRLGEELEAEEILHELPVDLLGPGPVEVTEGLEGADLRSLEAALAGALPALLLLVTD